MILQLKRLFERSGDRFDIDCRLSLEELSEHGGCESFSTPISLKGSVRNRAGMVSLDYACEFSVRSLCDRCLDEFESSYRFEFEHILITDESSFDGDSAVVCEGGSCDLDEIVISDILAELPTKRLCSENCKGLCPVCGQNLNRGECGCSARIDTVNE